jgi:hypothetical protein
MDMMIFIMSMAQWKIEHGRRPSHGMVRVCEDWKSSKGSSKGYHKGTPSWSYAEPKAQN